ncbi:MAG TPA: MBL fold metallo-hydrolase [Phenylobacterium sp.]|nr:MBL fold metallo-hydrolase [Phenylobacterium sp.]
MSQPKDAALATLAAQAALLASLPAEDGVDFERARRGFIDTLPDARVETARGGVAWDLSPFDFQGGGAPAPDTVNPSLWRLAQLNLNHGLYKVTEGIYQVRGFDLSNITFVEGNEGFIVVDPLTSAEPAAAALALMRKHRGDKPVSAVIYTHSHVDHYGGVKGVLTDADIAAGARIIAPEGFLAEAVSENVLAGNAMGRRATYMYGALLHRGPRGRRLLRRPPCRPAPAPPRPPRSLPLRNRRSSTSCLPSTCCTRPRGSRRRSPPRRSRPRRRSCPAPWTALASRPMWAMPPRGRG